MLAMELGSCSLASVRSGAFAVHNVIYHGKKGAFLPSRSNDIRSYTIGCDEGGYNWTLVLLVSTTVYPLHIHW